MIWKKSADLALLNKQGDKCAVGHMGIVITDIGDDYLTGTMPVDQRTTQPFGILHGGSSVLLAETLGSLAGNLAAEEGFICVGLDINANHLRAVTSGLVTATAKPIHIGRRTQVWQIDSINDQGKPVCTSRLTLSVQAPGAL